MFPLAHFFTAYLISDLVVPQVQQYVWQIFVLASIVDIDHIPGLIRLLLLDAERRKKVTISELVDTLRTPIQEPIGIATILALLGLFHLSGINHPLIPLAAIGVSSHYLIDLLSNPTRPFDPIDRKVYVLFLDTIQKRVIVETIFTLATGALFLFAYWK